MNVLITGYEAAPFYKRGGLGDVMESLPKALSKIGVDVRVVIPYYNDIKKKYNFKEEGEFVMKFESEEDRIGVYSSLLPQTKIPFYFLDNKRHKFISYKRGRDKINQFASFDLAVGHFIGWVSEHHHWSPDLIHCNDWHTAIIPLILRKKINLSIPTLLTIHNLMYQGVGSLKVLDLLHMKDEETKELKRDKPATAINFLGEGIIHATRVSTVSPTYAKEIEQTERDHSLISPFLVKREQEGLGKDRRVMGILNGIDYDIWDPAKDEFAFHKFDINNWEVGKKDNKDDLLKCLGLEDRPTFCFVGRMAAQKGLDILIKTINHISNFNVNIIILGSGTPKIQASVLKIAKKFTWVKAEVVYDEELAHKIYAGSDFIIVPSRYEPCGLIQMIAMRYGTIPIASDTGGLRDSILNGKNGFLFKKGKSIRLKKAIERALSRMQNKEKFKKMVERAMKTDFSWDKSAVLYKKLYEEMLR
ncbi:MAG: glycogen/starch synthase [Candidatus Levybacteria bacterium]|nr:glycogen/starch synthase [Candidatus Levybacteria bacterium]